VNSRAIQDITEFIFMDDAPQRSDVILVPGTAVSAITEKAAELYRAGYAPYVLPSGKYSSALGRFAYESMDDPRYAGEYSTEFEYCKRILTENGVPESAILREDRATNTMENAKFSAAVLKDSGIEVKRAIVCCKEFHARRAFLSYSCHLGSAELLVVPARTGGVTKNNWYLTEKGCKKVMGEVAKVGIYFADMLQHG